MIFRRTTVVNFHFINSKPTEKHLSTKTLIRKYQIAVYRREKSSPHGRRKDFCLGGGKCGEILFFPLETKKTIFFAKRS